MSSSTKPGVLYVTVLEGRNLPALDTNGSSDPFCELSIRDKTRPRKTAMIERSLNPQWTNENFQFDIENPDLEVLEVACWDWDRFTPNDYIGKVIVPLVTLKNKGADERWHKLLAKDGSDRARKNGKTRGELRLRFELCDYGEAPTGRPRETPALATSAPVPAATAPTPAAAASSSSSSSSSSSTAAAAVAPPAASSAPPAASSAPLPSSSSSSSSSSPSSLSDSLKVDMTSASPTWEIPFSEIRLEQELGRGAFGIVHRGKWRLQDVAVKQLQSTLSEKELNEFVDEAKLMMKLRPHRNVVQLYGICTRPICVVTEFLSGGSLESKLMKRDVAISWQDVHAILRGVCAGMHHLHAEGILHRDLAARNILIEGNWVPRVADFGLSKRVEPLPAATAGAAGATSGGGGANAPLAGATQDAEQLRGPFKYMAPESLAANQFSTKSDVYTFGIFTFETVCRTNDPFPGVDIYTAARQIIGGARPTIPPCLPPRFVQIMQMCWPADPAQRPSFAQLADFLDSIAAEVAAY